MDEAKGQPAVFQGEKVEKFCVSGGKIGYQVEITLEDLRKVIPVQTAEITV